MWDLETSKKRNEIAAKIVEEGYPQRGALEELIAPGSGSLAMVRTRVGRIVLTDDRTAQVPSAPSAD